MQYKIAAVGMIFLADSFFVERTEERAKHHHHDLMSCAALHDEWNFDEDDHSLVVGAAGPSLPWHCRAAVALAANRHVSHVTMYSIYTKYESCVHRILAHRMIHHFVGLGTGSVRTGSSNLMAAVIY